MPVMLVHIEFGVRARRVRLAMKFHPSAMFQSEQPEVPHAVTIVIMDVLTEQLHFVVTSHLLRDLGICARTDAAQARNRTKGVTVLC